MIGKYYKFIVIGNDKIGGVLYAPSNWPYPIAKDGEEIKNWESLVVELKDGSYRPLHMCVGGANLVNKELKTLIESHTTPESEIEFLPIKAISKEYGNKTYYIIHFKKIHDVIDKENTIYVKGTDSIIKLRVDYKKVKDLHIFNSQPNINDIIVSETLYKAIKKQKLNLGLDFMPIYYILEESKE